MRPYSPASTREESCGSPRNLKGCLTPLRQYEWFPEIPVTTREEPRVSYNKWKGHRVPPQLKIGPVSSATTQMEPRVSPHNMTGSLTPLLQLEKNPEFLTSARQ